MKKSFSARRVPRKVGQDEDEAAGDTSVSDEASEPTLKRPSTKPRKASSLRRSLADDDDSGDTSGVVTPKRATLSRLAIQRNASKRSSLLASNLPTHGTGEEEDRPSYTAESLQELKASTPSTPLSQPAEEADDEAEISHSTQALDLTSKFGTSLSRYNQQQAASAIPSAAEIAEKKDRRARLAKEAQAEEYISLDPDDPSLDFNFGRNEDDEEGDPNVTRDDSGRLIPKPKGLDKWGLEDSRLVRDDEDIMENFDEFTEDGKIHLGRRAEKEAEKRRREEMAAQIAAAERQGASDEEDDGEDSDASEKDRTAAFEAAQTRHGTSSNLPSTTTASDDPYAHLRPKTPSHISPLPTLDGVLSRLQKQLGELQSSRAKKLNDVEALRREKVRLAEEEVRIQQALKETAEKFRALRVEKGIEKVAAIEAPARMSGDAGKDGVVEAREGGKEGGVEQADGTGEQMGGSGGDDGGGEDDGEDDGDDDGARAGGTVHTGLGFVGLGSNTLNGMRSTAGRGMSRPPADEDDW